MSFLIAALIGFAIAGLAYIAVRLTVSFLRNYKKQKASKIVAAHIKDMVKNAPADSTIKLEDLEKVKDETILAEYNPDTDDVVQADFVNREKGMDEKIERAIRQHNGLLIIED